jgi:hypothetical protein
MTEAEPVSETLGRYFYKRLCLCVCVYLYWYFGPPYVLWSVSSCVTNCHLFFFSPGF